MIECVVSVRPELKRHSLRHDKPFCDPKIEVREPWSAQVIARTALQPQWTAEGGQCPFLICEELDLSGRCYVDVSFDRAVVPVEHCWRIVQEANGERTGHARESEPGAPLLNAGELP